jgi:membrane fusion protein (multidrug efflux system)
MFGCMGSAARNTDSRLQSISVIGTWDTMMTRHILSALAVAILSSGIAAFCLGSPTRAQQAGAPPPAVVVEKVKTLDVSDSARLTARVEAIEAVDVRARVTGFLSNVSFREGHAVKAGDALFEIEPTQLDARIASARAQLARAEATRKSAERTLSRNRDLFARNTVSQAVLDDSETAADIAAADVLIAQAALETAVLDRSYANIAAPISGSIGRAMFTAGNIVGPDSGPLARIVRLDPIRVAFSISEKLLVSVRQRQAAGARIDPDSLEFSVRLANGTDYAEAGQIDFVDYEVDQSTGTVTARAIFPNPYNVLIPGQFVTLHVREKDTPTLPVVPQTAVLQDRDGRYVYLLGKDNTVSQRRIDTGARVTNGWAVTDGLDGGEQVVVQGIQRLAEGMTVQPSEGQPIGGGS